MQPPDIADLSTANMHSLGVDSAIIGRIVERLFIVASATLCILLGWLLFKTGVYIEQQLSGEYKGAKVVLSRVGPGAIFALFGAGVLVFALWSPLETKMPMDGAQATLNYSTSDGLSDADVFYSLNEVFAVASTSDDKHLQLAASKLKLLKLKLALEKFGQDKLRLYHDKRDVYKTRPQDLTEDQRTLLQELVNTLDGRFDTGG